MRIKQLKYKQAEVELRQLASALPPGAKLPSERDLAIEYDCNFLTIRKALKILVDEGLIIRRIGSGTFIAESQHSAENDGADKGARRTGVLVFQPSEHYGFSVLQSIAHAALTENAEVRSAWACDFREDGLRQAERLAKEGCKALILPWFPYHIHEEIYSFVHRSPLPVSLPVLLPGLEKNCFEEAHLFGSVLLSATEGSCRYFRHLGHQRIAFLGPNTPGNTVFQNKLGAYTCYASQENLPMLCGLVNPGSQAIDQLAERWKIYRGDLAIVSYDDEHALRFMTAMHKLGLNAPDDYAIIGYNNIDSSHYSDPPLTTVRQDFAYIGLALLTHALALGRGEDHRSTRGPSLDLVVRSTCGGAARIDEALKAELKRWKLRVQSENNPHVFDSNVSEVSEVDLVPEPVGTP